MVVVVGRGGGVDIGGAEYLKLRCLLDTAHQCFVRLNLSREETLASRGHLRV